MNVRRELFVFLLVALVAAALHYLGTSIYLIGGFVLIASGVPWWNSNFVRSKLWAGFSVALIIAGPLTVDSGLRVAIAVLFAAVGSVWVAWEARTAFHFNWPWLRVAAGWQFSFSLLVAGMAFVLTAFTWSGESALPFGMILLIAIVPLLPALGIVVFSPKRMSRTHGGAHPSHYRRAYRPQGGERGAASGKFTGKRH